MFLFPPDDISRKVLSTVAPAATPLKCYSCLRPPSTPPLRPYHKRHLPQGIRPCCPSDAYVLFPVVVLPHPAGGISLKVAEAAAVALMGVPVLIARAGSAAGAEACRRGPGVLGEGQGDGDGGWRGTLVVAEV